ncbi:endo alpha-1,4 polygalactosaminidase [Kineococcus rubinsiae]|uniref:endo alpha-1,4 polygalactosaminidase n=1 Tax=Kineococcus rubinsiae TaxID=2609562 RepID=UPI0027E5A5D9|nr:endo alpha-1,4 polygalactosaminidase [Kineococcus rubinsiae]
MPLTPRTSAVAAALVCALLALGGCASGEPPVARRTPVPAPAGVVPPPVAAVVDYQLGGPYAPDPSVGVVVRDHGVEPVPGLYGICYVNAFQTQPEDAAWWEAEHPELLLRVDGRLVEDADWPGEFLLDTTTADDRLALAAIVGAWIDGCADAGYRAVEADNLDSWTRSSGALTQDGNLAYAALLTDRAHRRGLAMGQKNTAETTVAQARDVGFDYAVTESCQVYDECDAYTAVYGNHVIEVEYTDDGERYFQQACAARGDQVSVLLRDRDVVARGEPGYRYEVC